MVLQYATLGGLRIDYLITAQGEVGLGEMGGNALYSAVGARLWAQGVGIVARVAQNYPRAWLERVAAAGIDTSGARWVPGEHEMRTFYAHQPDGSRVESNPEPHFAALGMTLPEGLQGFTPASSDQSEAVYAALSVVPEDIPGAFCNVRAFHLAPKDLDSHQAVVPFLRARGIPIITLDPGAGYMCPEQESDVRALLEGVDVFLPSREEAQTLLGRGDLDAARSLAGWGLRVVVLKMGAQGSIVYDGERSGSWHIPAYPAQVRDVTGAGDAYCGGFMVGYAETGDPVEAALYGTVSASFVIEGFGALYARQFSRQQAEVRLHQLRNLVEETNL